MHGGPSRRISVSRVVASLSAMVVFCVIGGFQTATSASAAAKPVLKVMLMLAPSTTTVDDPVVASLATSVVPAGDHLSAITVNWGDGSTSAKLKSLSSRVEHKYLRSGNFTVKASVTDVHGKASSSTAHEIIRPGAIKLAAGIYSGVDPQAPNTPAYDFSFYVSNVGSSIQDVFFPNIDLSCAPGDDTPSVTVSLDSIPIKVNGAFGVTATQSYGYNGYDANLVINFNGNFASLTSGQPTLKGTLNETMSYSNGQPFKCSARNLVWSATRSSTQTVRAGRPPSGSYTGADPQAPNTPADDFSFYVSGTGTNLQDVAFPELSLTCAPGDDVPGFPLAIDVVPVASDGSFDTTTTQDGDYDGYASQFTVNFQGHFHGLDGSGDARLAGSLAETMSYTNGTSYTCMSNKQSWYASRDTEQTVTTGLPPTGTYRGGDPQAENTPADNFTFDVTASRRELQDLSFPTITLTCAPGAGTPDFPVSVPSVTLEPDGSFDATVDQTATYDSVPANFTINFQGYSEGLDASGDARFAGSFTETMTYTNGTAYSCTTNKLSWYATRSS